MKRVGLSLVVCLAVSVAGCGGGSSSPTSPSPSNSTPNAPAPTAQLYTLTGTISSAAGSGIAGATVSVADGPNAGKTSSADGSGRYSLSGLAFAGFTVNVSAPGFAGTSRGISLSASSTTATANFTLLPATLYTISGTGNTVFDMPTYIRRVRITGAVSGGCSNFIIWIGGDLEVNEIIGNCSIASGRTYEGIHAVTGGVVEVKNSNGVDWSITEVR